MSDPQDRQHDELRALLRQGDPAADATQLTAAEVTRMRARIKDAAATGRRASLFSLRPLPAFAGVAATLLLVLVGWNAMRPGPPSPTAGTEQVVSPATPDPERRTRQVQFSTPGGTRIIWLLDSEFEV